MGQPIPPVGFYDQTFFSWYLTAEYLSTQVTSPFSTYSMCMMSDAISWYSMCHRRPRIAETSRSHTCLVAPQLKSRHGLVVHWGTTTRYVYSTFA